MLASTCACTHTHTHTHTYTHTHTPTHTHAHTHTILCASIIHRVNKADENDNKLWYIGE